MTGEQAPRDPCVRELLARMSHDLRTPLNAILGFSEIIECELLGPLGTERYQRYATDIRTSGLSLLAAVESALAVTEKLAQGQLVSVAMDHSTEVSA